MIQSVTEFSEYRAFLEALCQFPAYSGRTAEELEQALVRAAGKPDHRVWGVFRDGAIEGLFSFLVLDEDRYLEASVLLSVSVPAYRELMEYLEKQYPGWHADFVFHPKNTLLRDVLTEKGAQFDTEQQWMTLTAQPEGIDTSGIKMLSPAYEAQYFAMHSRDVYWTGERVAEAKDQFFVLLAVEDGTVAGYIDVTHYREENEPYDLLVRPEYRRRGFGRKLLARAIELNAPKGMKLLVDVDNVPALRLYESLGFTRVEGKNNVTAKWEIKQC